MGKPFVGLWRHPDFLKLWAGQAVSALEAALGVGI